MEEQDMQRAKGHIDHMKKHIQWGKFSVCTFCSKTENKQQSLKYCIYFF